MNILQILRKNYFLQLAVLTVMLCGCNTAKQLPLAPDNNSLLWQISGKGLKTPSYLYGTIHLIPKADFFVTPSTREALLRSQQVTFEIDVKDMTNPMKLLGLLGKLKMTGNQKICDFLTQDECTQLKKKLEAKGIPFAMFERTKPLFLSSLVSGEDTEGGDKNVFGGSGKTVSYELEFMKIVNEENKKIKDKNLKKQTSGLETIELQMAIFDSIPYTEQAKMLLQAINSKEDSKGSFQQLVSLYKTQNVEAMSELMQSEEAGIGNYQNLFIGKRNRTWIPQMATLMQQKTVFFAVGAGHLGGTEGVIKLLREAGYTVQALK